MERVQVLIDKLIEQKRMNEAPAQMLITVQLLHTELQKLQQAKTTLGTSKVSVVMPNNTHFNRNIVEEKPIVAPVIEEKIEVPQPQIIPVKIEEQKPVIQEIKEEPKIDLYSLRKPSIEEILRNHQPEIQKEQEVEIKEIKKPTYTQHDFISESPTFLQHQPQKEIHELISDQKESLNDRLKEDKKELGHSLKDTPVKDLRKAIGINDKFLFLNELFRGDDAMYERSIKTINGFRILSEAEYWINRELKVKLGWNDSKDTVQHFYQLVRRRFS